MEGIIIWTIVIISVGAGIVKLTGKYNGYAEQFSPIGGIASACGALALIMLLLLFNSLGDDGATLGIVLEILGFLLLLVLPFIISSHLKICATNDFILYRFACGVGIAFLVMFILYSLTNKKRKDD